MCAFGFLLLILEIDSPLYPRCRRFAKCARSQRQWGILNLTQSTFAIQEQENRMLLHRGMEAGNRWLNHAWYWL